MAFLIQLSEQERALVVRSLIPATAAAAAVCPAQHGRLLADLRIVCRAPAFIVTDAGCKELADLIVSTGAEREHVLTVGALLARLVAAGVHA